MDLGIFFYYVLMNYVGPKSLITSAHCSNRSASARAPKDAAQWWQELASVSDPNNAGIGSTEDRRGTKSRNDDVLSDPVTMEEALAAAPRAAEV